MNPYLKNLNRIEFVVTMACTGKCRHCSQGDHNNTDKLDKHICADAVRKIAGKYSITSVMTFGGEPLLASDTVFEIHKAAKEMNIPKRQLITNGYFSKDFDKIKSTAQKISECGVNDLLLSVDAFHQETIPLGYIKAFAEEILKTDVSIRVQPAWLVSPDADNIYNNETKDILKSFNDMGVKANEGNIIWPAGNALKYLSQYFDLSKQEKSPYEENPEDIRAICFGANGDILGSNIYEKDIMDILEEYTVK